MPTLQTYKDVYLWNYVPSLPASVVVGCLFAIASAFHTWKMIKTKLWFCSAFAAGGIFEVIGFAARAASTYYTGSLGVYIIQAIFLVLPPVLFAATLYMVYSRIVRSVRGEAFSLTSPRWTTILFVFGDFVCLNVQGNASPLLAQPDKAMVGKYIVVGGLILQLFMFVGFMACCWTFQVRFRAHVRETCAVIDVPWVESLNMLYGTSTLVLIRNVYRVFEFALGEQGYLMKHEWPLYVFDSALMLAVMVGFYVWYPSSLQLAHEGSMIELRSGGNTPADHSVEEK